MDADSYLLNSSFLLFTFKSGEINGIHTRATAFTEPDTASYIMVSILEWIQPFDALRLSP